MPKRSIREPSPPRGSNLTLSFFVFLGSFLGAVIGAIASINDLQDGLKTVIANTEPSIEMWVVGSDSVLGENLGVADTWVRTVREQQGASWEVPFLGRVTNYPDIRAAAVGSRNGLEMTLEGRGHLLVMSDPLDTIDLQSLNGTGIDIRCAAVIGYDAIVFVTDPRNPIPGIPQDALREILDGELTDWSDIGDDIREGKGPLRILAREGSGTTRLVVERFTGKAGMPADYVRCESNNACLNDSLAIRGSLYWASRTWLTLKPDAFRHPVRILRSRYDAGDDPLAAGFNPNEYPPKLLRALYMYVLEGSGIARESSDLAESFLRHVLDVEGQQALVERRFITYLDAPDGIDIELPPGFGQRSNDGRIQVCR